MPPPASIDHSSGIAAPHPDDGFFEKNTSA
jgi:hypothetical protein